MARKYTLGPGAPDPLLAWHAAARAEHMELAQFEWRDGEVHAADWEANGMLMSVRANLILDRTVAPPTATVAKIHGDRFTAVYSAKRERAANKRPWGQKTTSLDGTAADAKLRQETLTIVNGMRFLIWGTLLDDLTPSQWKKVTRTWRKHVQHDRVAFWSEVDGSPVAGTAHNPRSPDSVGIVSAIRWIPNAEPALLGMVAARMRLRLRGRVPVNAGGRAAVDKPIYQWLFDDYQRACAPVAYDVTHGAR